MRGKRRNPSGKSCLTYVGRTLYIRKKRFRNGVFSGCSLHGVFCQNYNIADGTIVRHLLLPGQIEDSKSVIKYLPETYGEDIYISILNQYTPVKGDLPYPELNRRIRDSEYEEIIDFAIDLAISNGFVQEGETASESFIPKFDYEGL